MRRLFLAMIRGYQRYISPGLPQSCRFTPTCSQYAYEAFARFGVFPGLYLTIRRVLKCQPFHRGGFDPVPDRIVFMGMRLGQADEGAKR